jgi:MULE transposase domain
MLTSNATTDTISFFISWVKDGSPAVRPSIIMTDRDQAQMAAIEEVYPQSRIFLCTWHVLHAMVAHFSTSKHPALWEKIKKWVKTDSWAEFDQIKDEILDDPSTPASFVVYLKQSWIPIVHQWSIAARKGRSIFEEGETNMLIEAYVIGFCSDKIKLTYSRFHHKLKSDWLDGMRNRRIDHVMHTLVQQMVPDYQERHALQNVGLAGPDLAGRRRQEILKTARGISADSIQQFDLTQFHVASQSRPGSYYAVDLNRATCDCADFPRAQFCKHIGAIYLHFPHLFAEKFSLAASPGPSQTQGVPQRIVRPEESLQALKQDITALIDQMTPSHAVMEAVRSAKYSLTAAIASTEGASASLPHKDVIAPNQHSWPETAERMGVKRASKRKRLPEEHGLTVTVMRAVWPIPYYFPSIL